MHESAPADILPPGAAEAAPHDPFALDEKSDDPAAALESVRHNCCDEMPAKELQDHTSPLPLREESKPRN